MKPIPAWSNALHVCNDPYAGILLFASIITILCMAYATQVIESPRWDWNKLFINGIACFLNVPCRFAPQSNPVRVGFIAFLFGCVSFNTIFMARFIAWTTQTVYEDPFETLNDIINNGYNLSGDSFAFDKMSELNVFREHPDVLNARFDLCETFDNCLHQFEMNEQLAMAISNEYYESVIMHQNEEIYCLTETELSFRRGSIFLLRNTSSLLLRQLNQFIVQANEAGLIVKWLRSLYHSKNVKKHRNAFMAELTWDQLVALPIIIGILLIFAGFIFVAEIIIHSKNLRSDANIFWRFAGLLIDPDRHFIQYDLRFIAALSYPLIQWNNGEETRSG